MIQDFFERNKWEPGQVDWHFLVLFNDQPQVAQLAENYKPVLKHDGLHDAIPPEWLHITMLRVGPTTKISKDEMDEICNIIHAALSNITLPELQIGKAWSWNGSVCLRVEPDKPLQQLFNSILSATQNVLGERAPKPKEFIPHITLAYPKKTDKEQEISDQIKRHTTSPIKAQPSTLSLVAQRQTPPYYQWDVARHIGLGYD